MKKTNTKVTIDGKSYKIDLERAKKLKIISECNNIESFKTGDLFRSEKGNCRIIVVETGYFSGMYNIMGIDGFRHYSDFPPNGISEEKMLDFLNGSKGSKYVFVMNLNDHLNDMIEEICDEV